MTAKDFRFYREKFQKTQKQMAEILGVSLKAIQSFEQGWRKVPDHVERQVFFLLAMKYKGLRSLPHCWDQKKCHPESRRSCPAWEFHCGDLCWFINGTICHGNALRSWKQKMKICRRCSVFTSFLGSCRYPPSPKLIPKRPKQ